MPPASAPVHRSCIGPTRRGAFGGDPGSVTLFGQSGVGTKVAILLAIALAGRCERCGHRCHPGGLERIKAFGVDVGVNYQRDDLVAAVMAATDRRGVDVVLDGVGGATLQKSIQVLAFKERCTFIGFSGCDASRIDAGPLRAANRSLIGLGLVYEMTTERVRKAVRGYLEDLATGRLQMPIDREFPLSEAAAAHAHIEIVGAIVQRVPTDYGVEEKNRQLQNTTPTAAQ